MREWHGGKGSKRRPETDTSYQDNWEKIFNKKKGGKMPIKIKKSEQVADRQTGKVTTTHHYAKCASVEELHELVSGMMLQQRRQVNVKKKQSEIYNTQLIPST